MLSAESDFPCWKMNKWVELIASTTESFCHFCQKNNFVVILIRLEKILLKCCFGLCLFFTWNAGVVWEVVVVVDATCRFWLIWGGWGRYFGGGTRVNFVGRVSDVNLTRRWEELNGCSSALTTTTFETFFWGALTEYDWRVVDDDVEVDVDADVGGVAKVAGRWV